MTDYETLVDAREWLQTAIDALTRADARYKAIGLETSDLQAVRYAVVREELSLRVGIGLMYADRVRAQNQEGKSDP